MVSTSWALFAVQATSRGWNGPVSEVSGSGRVQAALSPSSPVGRTTVQSPPVGEVTSTPSCRLFPPSPALRLKAMRRPSGENAGLSSMTLQAPGQFVRLRSLCRARSSAGTVHRCRLPALPLTTAVREKTISLPSGDQKGWPSEAPSWPAGGRTVPTIVPVETSAIRIRPGRPGSWPVPGVLRLNTIRRPSGETDGSVSRSSGPRPARFIGCGFAPSASASQIRWIRPAGESS